jgi:enoyl-CoA hydratase
MIELEIIEGVATCILDAPPANTINPEWCARFHAALDKLEESADWRVLHIRSALRLFCAGADLKHIAARFTSPHGKTEFSQALLGFQKLFSRIEQLPYVTLAEIAGQALGGGLELALACDLRVVASDAKLGLPEVGLGLLPAIGGTQRLTALCGQAVAKRLILGAEIVTGTEAVDLGLAQWAFPADRLALEASTISRRIAKMPGLALRLAKDCIAATGNPPGSGFQRELDHSDRLYSSEQTRRIVLEFVHRKRKS